MWVPISIPLTLTASALMSLRLPITYVVHIAFESPDQPR